jgi:hypothetical protein
MPRGRCVQPGPYASLFGADGHGLRPVGRAPGRPWPGHHAHAVRKGRRHQHHAGTLRKSCQRPVGAPLQRNGPRQWRARRFKLVGNPMAQLYLEPRRRGGIRPPSKITIHGRCCGKQQRLFVEAGQPVLAFCFVYLILTLRLSTVGKPAGLLKDAAQQGPRPDGATQQGQTRGAQKRNCQKQQSFANRIYIWKKNESMGGIRGSLRE